MAKKSNFYYLLSFVGYRTTWQFHFNLTLINKVDKKLIGSTCFIFDWQSAVLSCDTLIVMEVWWLKEIFNDATLIKETSRCLFENLYTFLALIDIIWLIQSKLMMILQMGASQSKNSFFIFSSSQPNEFIITFEFSLFLQVRVALLQLVLKWLPQPHHWWALKMM